MRSLKDAMARWCSRYHVAVSFMVLLVFCTVMVLRQFRRNESRHLELREAFVLLSTKGYTNQAQRLYTRLLLELETASSRTLYDDFQRTLTLINPAAQESKNLIWKYHWTVSNELEKRSERNLAQALKLAE